MRNNFLSVHSTGSGKLKSGEMVLIVHVRLGKYHYTHEPAFDDPRGGEEGVRVVKA